MAYPRWYVEEERRRRLRAAAATRRAPSRGAAAGGYEAGSKSRAEEHPALIAYRLLCLRLRTSRSGCWQHSDAPQVSTDIRTIQPVSSRSAKKSASHRRQA